MRYSRQEIIKGWNQDKLKNSKVVVVGSNNLASFVLLDLISMGFGNITRVGDHSFSFVDFKKINPEVSLHEIPDKIYFHAMAQEYIGKPDLLIETSRSNYQKSVCLEHALGNDIPTISARCSSGSYSILQVEKNKDVETILGSHNIGNRFSDGELNAIIVSGILVNEARKKLMPLENDQILNEIFVKNREYDQINSRILMVGAGATGTFAGIGLACKGAKVDIVDFDEVEESNLNRQILFYDSIGKYKSEVMADKLSICKDFKGIVEKVDGNFKLKDKYDVILSCVDNKKARYYLDLISYNTEIPLINCGTSSFAGIVNTYFPGKTACLDCQMFGALTDLEKEEKNNSCYEPGIITTNQTIGGLLVSRIPRLYDTDLYTIKYDCNGQIKKLKTLEKCLSTCKK
ncbi:MAG: ThiF family adenylyltransferase [archaeon]